MYAISARALTPAAIMRLAKVCRASCRVIGSSPARRQAFAARCATLVSLKARSPWPRPSTQLACRGHLLLDEDIAKDAGDGYLPATGPALRLYESSRARIPRSLHTDYAGRKVHVRPAQGHELAPTQTGVESKRPEASVTWLEHGQQGGRRLRRDDSVTSASDGRKAKVVAWVDRRLTVLDRPPVDDSERHQHITNGRGVLSTRQELVGEPLNVAALEIRKLERARASAIGNNTKPMPKVRAAAAWPRPQLEPHRSFAGFCDRARAA